MLKNLSKIIVIFIFGMAGGIFADQIFWPYFVERPLFYKYDLDRPPIYIAETKEIIIRENVALQEAVLQAQRAVVEVRTQTLGGIILQGYGLVVTSDGLMVTLANLVPAGSTFTFSVEGEPVSFQILRRDLQTNLALVRIEGANFSTVGFADIARLRLGERVFLLGTGAVNEGIVRSFDESSIETNIFESSTLTGTPLFNIEGRALGITTIDRQGRASAIPISFIRAFLGF